MGKKWDGVQYIRHGGEDDTLFISEDMRRCATCGDPKTKLEMYIRGAYISLDCRTCVDRRKELEIRHRKTAEGDPLALALAKATNRRVLMEEAPSTAEAARQIIRNFGGEEKTWKWVTNSMKKAMKSNKPDVARKAAEGVFNMVAVSEKLAAEQIDTSQFTDEDRITIFMEPARQFILENEQFRRLLLNEPDVRKALLLTEGVTVLDVKPEDPPRLEE